MTMTDVPLSWVMGSAVLLAGVLAAVTVMARGRRPGTKKTGEDGVQADSWEQLEQRRRRKETVYATAAYLLLFCCAAVAAALSFHGLVGFGQQNLRLSGGWEYLVPFGLDGAAMFSAVIAVREASHGDASLGSRLLVWAFAGAAAWFNWVHAPRGSGHDGAPQFFAGMSLSAAILFDRALKQTRRAALREQGLAPRPLPQIRVVRWLRAPRETFRAWSLMLLEGVRSLDEAVEEVRADKRRHEQERLRRREQGKLDRARVKALNRQHRGRMRGRGRRRADAAFAAAAPDGAGGTGVHTGRTDSVSGTGSDGGAPSMLPLRSPHEPYRSGTGDGTSLGVDGGEGGEGGESGTLVGAASPRLDSLEEKLAQIEKQFG